MSMKDAYKQKIEAEIGLAQAKLAEFKAEAVNFTADARIKYAKHVEELDGMAHTAHEKLTELGKAGDDSWEHLKGGVEAAWNSLSEAITNLTEKFKSENTNKDSEVAK